MASNDTPASIALNPAAPASERYDATIAAHQGIGHLIPAADLAPVIDYINASMEESALKSIQNVVPNPPRNRGKPGGQSVFLDDFQVSAQGEYWDRPGLLGFDSMRAMVEQTPILNSIVLTRVKQVQRFCRVQASRADAGFIIAHVDKNQELNDEQRQSVQLLQTFVTNCGWEADPRQRKRLKRDSFSHFMAKLTRDTLCMDAAPIETEFKRDSRLGIDGLYAVDGGTIRLCTEEGYRGDDEIFALQVVTGNIRTAYGYDDLIYEVRNPRTDVTTCGYGYGEPEMLIRVVTYLLNAMTYNANFFDKNSIPKGILHLAGDYAPEDLAAFKRYWNAMVRGITNTHNMPIMVAKDADSKATWEGMGDTMDDMAFGKWLTFLTAISCAIYGISPEEVSMESFSAQKSSLSGDDTEERITSSKDKGLRPLMSYFENTYSDFIIRSFSDQYVLRFVGMEGDDEKQRFEARKLVMSLDEFRQIEGIDPWADDTGLGSAPLNPTLMSAWQAAQQAKQQQDAQQQAGEQEDFGNADDFDEQDVAPQDGSGPGKFESADEQRQREAKLPKSGAPDFGKPPTGEDMGKAFGLPDLHIYGLEQ